MKIKAIENTNFKGLFTDKTAENHGNWRMEYRPYSWEMPKAKKEQIDVFSSTLPTNEEIYTQEPNFEISRDILGTKSYIKDTRNGHDLLRTQIDDMPSMNLEESLKVRMKKLELFLKMKKDILDDIKEPLNSRMKSMFDVAHKHELYASDITKDWGCHDYSKTSRADGARKTFDKMTGIAERNGQDFQKYISLTESSFDVFNEIQRINAQLLNIEAAKAKNNLIDISRRDIDACNEPLQMALQNLEKAKGKLVALSNCTITVDEILKVIGKDFKISKAIEYVEKLMTRKI